MYKKINNSLMAKASNYAFDNNIPLYTTLELTQNCNFSCRHCYNFNRNDGEKKGQSKQVLSTEQWKNIIDQVISQGAFYISFTGGEPLLYPGIIDLIKHVRSYHCIAKLKTNASLLTKQKVEEIFEAGIYSIEVSLYGSNMETYVQFTGNELFLKTLEGIDNALAMGIDVVINILLHQGNYRQIGEMIDIAKSRGLYFNISSEITDRYDGTGGTSLWRLTEEQNKWLYQSDFSHYFDFDNSEKNVQCSCARTVCGINYKGDIYPCIGAPMFSGSVMKESFSAIWNDSKALNGIRNLTKEDFSECMECELIEKCSRSSGSVYVNTGKYTGCEEQTRKEAKLRKNFFTVKK